VSTELFINWYDDGEPGSVPFDDVVIAFAPAIDQQRASGFTVRYDDANESDVYAVANASGDVTDIMISRPNTAPAFWKSVIIAMKLGNAICFWPGGPPVVASQAAAKHVPDDIVDALGELRIVSDGEALASLVAAS